MKVEYSSNNSGGSWWLSDDDWKSLENAGWDVNWAKDWDGEAAGGQMVDEDGRYMGALAHDATLECDSMADAIRSFEASTGQSASDEGCNCCAPPHSFSTDDGPNGWECVSGEEVLSYLYENVPSSLREAVERLNDR